jgi:hypothetical protein
MSPSTNRKIFYSLALVGIAIVVTIPDVIFGLLLELFHTVFELFLELLHILFEAIESALDHLIEHLFHTELHVTQLIVFYILLLMAIGISYGLWRLMSPFCHRCKNNAFTFCLKQKVLMSQYWFNLSLFNKIQVITITAGFAYLFFLVSF